MTWDASLPKFDDSNISAIFGDVDVNRDQGACLDEWRTTSRTATKRRFARLELVAQTAKVFGRLPEPGESIHGVMSANYDGWAMVPALLELAEGATLDHLWIATLGFNRDNMESLASLMDAKLVHGVSFVASVWFRSTDTTIWEHTAAELGRRGQRCVAVRSHAKILLFELSDGRKFAWEASANLRSSSNVEQFALHHAPDLVEFHKGWLNDLITQALAAEARKTHGTQGKEAQAGCVEEPRRQPRQAEAKERRAKPAARKGNTRSTRPPGRAR